MAAVQRRECEDNWGREGSSHPTISGFNKNIYLIFYLKIVKNLIVLTLIDRIWVRDKTVNWWKGLSHNLKKYGTVSLSRKNTIHFAYFLAGKITNSPPVRHFHLNKTYGKPNKMFRTRGTGLYLYWKTTQAILCITLIRIRITLFILIRTRIRLSLFCWSGSGFCSSSKWCEICDHWFTDPSRLYC
jgi:hypothetical protein